MTTDWLSGLGLLNVYREKELSSESVLDNLTRRKNRKLALILNELKHVVKCLKITLDEKLVYSPHPEVKNKTCLKQEAVINVKSVPLGSYIESFVCDHISKNASKGREAMDHVINTIKLETVEVQKEAKHAMESINLNFDI